MVLSFKAILFLQKYDRDRLDRPSIPKSQNLGLKGGRTPMTSQPVIHSRLKTVFFSRNVEQILDISSFEIPNVMSGGKRKNPTKSPVTGKLQNTILIL